MNILGRSIKTLIAKPTLHHRDLIVLRQRNARGYCQNRRVVSALLSKRRHLFRLRVVWNHAAQELNVA